MGVWPVGVLVRFSKFPKDPDSKKIIGLYSLPFFLGALLPIIVGEMDHIVFVTVTVFHHFAPCQRTHADKALVLLFALTLIVYCYKHATNEYAETCVNNLLPPRMDVFRIEHESSSLYNITLTLNPDVLDGTIYPYTVK